MITINGHQRKIICMAVRIVNWHEEIGRVQHHQDRSFLRDERTLLSSRLLFTCSTVGAGGTYPGFTVVKELFEKTCPPEDMAGDTVPDLVGVGGRSELEVGGSSSGDEGKY